MEHQKEEYEFWLRMITLLRQEGMIEAGLRLHERFGMPHAETAKMVKALKDATNDI